MKPDIKHRIEQVRRGEVPEGYKKGKLGIVSEEWNETSFSTLFTNTSDYTDDLDTYPLYSLTIEDGIIPKTERYERSHLVKKEDSYKIVRPNDYAYNPMNLRFGAVARHKGDMPVAVSGYYDIFTTVFESDLPFMDSFLTCGPMITYYNRVSTGSLIEKQRVHFSQFLEFVLPLPSINERAKIAAILTTQDRVIELKQQLLAQKQQQKKYLMQQLLTGKKRLPGFSGEWKKVRLHDLCTYMNEHSVGSSTTYVSTENMLPNLSSSVIFETEDYPVTGIKYQKGDILIGNIRPYLKKIWLADRNGICSTDVLVLHTHSNTSADVYNFIATDNFFSYIMIGAKGSKMPRGDKKHIMDYQLFMSNSEVEKESLSQVLFAANHEIELLQQNIEQEKQKKKALMQLLLTGIVRVSV